MRVIRSSGSVRGEDGNILAYSARCLDDAAALVEAVEAGITVGLQHAFEARQMSERACALAVRGGEKHGRR